MKVKTIYFWLGLVGAILPYWQFLPWVLENGFNLRLLLEQLFANRISAFFGLDVLISAATAIVFFRMESSRLNMGRPWLPVLAVFTVGVSLGRPLFLYLRESKLSSGTV
jgi:hypothetical protein